MQQNKITITNLKPKNIEETSKMIQKSIKESFKKTFPETLINTWINKYTPEKLKTRTKTINYYIAQNQNNKILGIIGLEKNEIRTFFVHPNHQRQKIGTQLYNHIENITKNQNYSKIFVKAGIKGVPAYKKFGLKPIKIIHKQRENIHYTDTLMEKKLT